MKGKGHTKAIILLMIMGIFALFSFPPQNISNAQATTFLRTEPPGSQSPQVQKNGPLTIIPGQQVLINVTIADVENLWGYNFTLGYDPLLLRYQGVIIFPFLNKPYSSTKIITAGAVFVGVESRGPAVPVSGSGRLVSIVFEGVATGKTDLDLRNDRLWRQDKTLVDHATSDGVIVVSTTSLSVIPSLSTGPVGETVTLNMTVLNVQNLYGIEFKVAWQSQILRLIKIDIYLPWSNPFKVKNETTAGTYWFGWTALLPSTAFNGNHTFVAMRFQVLKTGLSILNIYESRLGDPSLPSKPIAHAEVDGVFTNVETMIGIQPDLIVDYNLGPGSNVSLNVTVEKAVELESFYISIEFEPTVINCTSISFIGIYVSNSSFIGNMVGEVILNATLPSPLTGDLKLATIQFEVISRGDTDLLIKTQETQLTDPDGNPIPYRTRNGRIVNWRSASVQSLITDLPEAFPGRQVKINATVANDGALDEVVQVLIWHNASVTVDNQTQTIQVYLLNETVSLGKPGSGNDTHAFFVVWNTTGLTPGKYVITANATLIGATDENPADNTASILFTVLALIHDLKVGNVMTIPDTIYLGNEVRVTIIVQNVGTEDEVANVTVTLGGQEVARFMDIALPAKTGDIRFLSLPMNTLGSFVLNVSISVVPFETNVGNNKMAKTLNVRAISAGLLTPEAIAGIVIAVIAVAIVVVFIRRRK